MTIITPSPYEALNQLYNEHLVEDTTYNLRAAVAKVLVEFQADNVRFTKDE